MENNEIITDEDLQPKAVRTARNRTDKKDRLNSIYLVVKDIHGRDNALHTKQIKQIIVERYGIEDISTCDITEACNRLRDMGRLPFLLSERAHGIYNALNMDEFKIGIYEAAQMMKGYYNRFVVMRDLFVDKFGYGIIPDDPFDYKEQIGRELRGEDDEEND